MRPWILMALLAASAGAFAAKPDPVPGFERPVMTMQVDGEVEIGRAGDVLSYVLGPTRKPLPPVVADRLSAQVKGWTFDPVMVGGAPVVARTTMRVTLMAVERQGGFEITVDNVTFPRTRVRGAVEVDDAPGRKMHMVSRPRLDYPAAFIDRRLDASVLVALNIAPDGTLIDAAVVQSSIPDRTGDPVQFQRLAAVLEQEVLKGVRATRFAVEVPPGADNSEPFHAMLPIEFHVGDRPTSRVGSGQWRVERRSTKRPPEWVAAADREAIAGVSDLNEGESPSDESAPRLRTSARGTVL